MYSQVGNLCTCVQRGKRQACCFVSGNSRQTVAIWWGNLSLREFPSVTSCLDADWSWGLDRTLRIRVSSGKYHPLPHPPTHTLKSHSAQRLFCKYIKTFSEFEIRTLSFFFQKHVFRHFDTDTGRWNGHFVLWPNRASCDSLFILTNNFIQLCRLSQVLSHYINDKSTRASFIPSGRRQCSFNLVFSVAQRVINNRPFYTCVVHFPHVLPPDWLWFWKYYLCVCTIVGLVMEGLNVVRSENRPFCEIEYFRLNVFALFIILHGFS